jgi:hypothetical protein
MPSLTGLGEARVELGGRFRAEYSAGLEEAQLACYEVTKARLRRSGRGPAANPEARVQ